MRIAIDIPDEQIKKSLKESEYINKDGEVRGTVIIEMRYTNGKIEFVDIDRRGDFYSCNFMTFRDDGPAELESEHLRDTTKMTRDIKEDKKEMERKGISDFTEEEKNWMDAIVINQVIAQSDGFQLGYAQAIADFTKNIVDYWEYSDDRAQKSVLNAIVDLGVELGNRKEIAEENVDVAKKQGYERNCSWKYKHPDKQYEIRIPVFTKEFKNIIKDEVEGETEPDENERK